MFVQKKKQKQKVEKNVRDFEAEERINRALRSRRRAEMRRRRRRRAQIRRALVLAGTGLCLFLIIFGVIGAVRLITGHKDQGEEQTAVLEKAENTDTVETMKA